MENFVAGIFEESGAVNVHPYVNVEVNGISQKMIRWICQVPENVNEQLYVGAILDAQSQGKRILYYSQIGYDPEFRVLICHVFYE